MVFLCNLSSCTRLLCCSKDVNTPECVRIAIAVGLLVLSNALEHRQVIAVELNVLEVGNETRRCDRLGDNAGTALATPCNENVGIGALVLLGDLGNLS